MSNMHSILIVVVCVIVTVLLRTGPFIIWSGNRKTPEYVIWLGNVLPYSIMGMLVVFCVRNVEWGQMSGAMPTVVALLLTAVVQIWKRNSIYSIIAGTICYMVLIALL